MNCSSHTTFRNSIDAPNRARSDSGSVSQATNQSPYAKVRIVQQCGVPHTGILGFIFVFGGMFSCQPREKETSLPS
jgi:hypothetical protein